MSFLKLQDVQFTYPGRKMPALCGINLSAEKGTHIAVIGNNGSGKSTLARIIAGFFKPDSGTVTLEGVKLPGIVFQQPKEQIVAAIAERDTAFGPENLKLTKDEIELRTIECLNAVSLGHKAFSGTYELSLGQTQRLAFAGILALFPDLLILDEVTAMLDPESRKEVFDFITSWHKKGNTVIHVTHDENEALSAERILALEKGKIIFDGSPGDFKKDAAYKNIFGSSSLDELKALRKNTDKNETALLAENLSFSYGEEKIFSGLNLELKKGSLISLTGKSGCGKSTLFECLCGLLKPETGNLYAEKRPALALQESEASLFEKFAADDVAFGAIKKGLEGKELLERVKSSMELAGLSWTEYRDKPVFYLSGGEKRKVSIASIFALGNDIMIFDEPTSALDPASRKNILKAFRKLTDEGKTILFSTHRPEEQMAADVNLKWEDLINQNEALKKEVSRPLPELSQIKNAGLITSARKLSSSFSSPAERKKSPVSKFPPVVRFLIFLTLFFSSLFTTSIPATSVCLSSSVLYTFFCRSPFFKPLKTFIKILPFVIFLAVIQFLFFPSSESDIVLLKLKFFTLTDTKLLFIAHVILRAMTAVFAVSTFLNITSERDFTDALKDFLKPLTLIKIPVRYLITVVTVVFRFMPLMLDDFILIIKTQIIRGSYADAKGIKKIKMLVSLLAPLLLHSFRKAQFLADALTARHFK